MILIIHKQFSPIKKKQSKLHFLQIQRKHQEGVSKLK